MNSGIKSVFVAIPTYSGTIDYSTELSLSRAREECAERGWVMDKLIRTSDALITRARDVLVASFLSTECTDLLFVDADVAWRKGSFAQLMSHDVDFVAGLYREKRDPENYTVRSLPDAMVVDSRGLIEVAAVPTGFMRIRRAAIERMVEARKDDWYKDPTAGDLKVHRLFYTEVRDHKLWSEDFNFCRVWREELGGKVWVDPNLTTYHTGKSMFTGHFMRFLERHAERAPEPQQEPTTVLDRAKAAAAE